MFLNVILFVNKNFRSCVNFKNRFSKLLEFLKKEIQESFLVLCGLSSFPSTLNYNLAYRFTGTYKIQLLVEVFSKSKALYKILINFEAPSSKIKHF